MLRYVSMKQTSRPQALLVAAKLQGIEADHSESQLPCLGLLGPLGPLASRCRLATINRSDSVVRSRFDVIKHYKTLPDCCTSSRPLVANTKHAMIQISPHLSSDSYRPFSHAFAGLSIPLALALFLKLHFVFWVLIRSLLVF